MRSAQRPNLLDSSTFVAIPQEILERILQGLPANREGRRALIACALVATWWTEPSQRCLFSSVFICERNYKRWMNSVVLPESKVHLLGYVRSLSQSLGRYHQIRDLPGDAGKYFPALRNLCDLTLSNIEVKHISEEDFCGCFSAFRETLTRLSLVAVATSFSAFTALVGYFPNVTTLQIESVVLRDEGSAPSLSRPLRGTVYLHLKVNSPKFLDQFAKLDLEYEELIIDTFLYGFEVKSVESALRISTSTVKFLRLIAELECERSLPTLFVRTTSSPNSRVQAEPALMIHDFRQLQELELVVTWPSPAYETILSSITSTELRKVIFFVWTPCDWTNLASRTREWDLIDKQLCGLVDRLHVMGYDHTLEAELHLRGIVSGPGEDGFIKFLPGFRERGIVTIIDANRGDHFLRSSARTH